MKKKIIARIVLLGLTGLLFVRCVDPYEPHITKSETDILVVEGSINGGGFPTRILLSRTVGLNEDIISNPEKGATVRVDGDSGFSQLLTETADGHYTGTLNLSLTEKYRLYIKSSNGLEYATEYTPVLITPEIDSISWKQHDNRNVTIYASTHDPSNNTWYYRWEYDEDWQFTAPVFSQYQWVNHKIVERPYSENIYYCWNKKSSTQVVISTSTNLLNDVIFELPIQAYTAGDQELSHLYRIRVKQYALSQEAYQYWLNLQKNTEGGNDLFSPQPSEMAGNITCLTEPSIPVTGYVEACIPTTEDQYISIQELSLWNATFSSRCIMTLDKDLNPYAFMESKTDIERLTYLMSMDYMPITDGDIFGTVWILHKNCGDCRVNGTKNKPVDWPTAEI